MSKILNLNKNVIANKVKQSDEIATPYGLAMTQECGRSMVEMLGVLAVIGVLSVAGIAGYSIAMRNHRANEVLNAASMLYVMAQAKNQGNGADTNYTELGTAPSGTTLAYSASAKAITITFNDEKDCTAAKNKLGDKAEGTCAAGSSTLTVKLGKTGATNTGPEINDGDDCSDSSFGELIICLNGKEYYCDYNNWQYRGECTPDCFEHSKETIGETEYCCSDGVWSACLESGTQEPEAESGMKTCSYGTQIPEAWDCASANSTPGITSNGSASGDPDNFCLDTKRYQFYNNQWVYCGESGDGAPEGYPEGVCFFNCYDGAYQSW